MIICTCLEVPKDHQVPYLLYHVNELHTLILVHLNFFFCENGRIHVFTYILFKQMWSLCVTVLINLHNLVDVIIDI